MTELAYELQPQPEAGQHIRQALGEHLRGHVPDDLLEDLFAVVTELVNNSVLYGPGEPIQVELTIAQDGRLRGEVTDHGDGDVAIRAISDDRGGGLGLLLVDALADHWAVHEGSTTVWFELSGTSVDRGKLPRI